MDQPTIKVYEARAAEWQAARPVRVLEQVAALGRAVPTGAARIDLGCGVGRDLAALGAPVVALDAAAAMLALARVEAPDAWCVQADLERLPIRDGSLHGAWAWASYLHIPPRRLPWALMELHQALAVGSAMELVVRRGSNEGALADDTFPGRLFAEWEPDPLGDVVTGAGFDVHHCAVETSDQTVETADQEWVTVRATRARTLPDFVAPQMRMLVCGLNPSVYAADRGVGFGRPGNRFWPAALEAGLVSRDRDPRHALIVHGMGMTDLVKRATARADAIGAGEYRTGAQRLERLVRWLKPGVVCFAGLSGYRVAVDRNAVAGPVPDGFAGRPAYVMPNPSGVNTHVSLDDLAEHLRAAAALGLR